VTLAHDGAARYCERYGLVYRREAERPNDVWQADHTQLDVLPVDQAGKRPRPWLTVILDDHSRAVAGPLSTDELQFVLAHHWNTLGLILSANDLTTQKPPPSHASPPAGGHRSGTPGWYSLARPNQRKTPRTTKAPHQRLSHKAQQPHQRGFHP
jgi:hypothetical protein